MGRNYIRLESARHKLLYINNMLQRNVARLICVSIQDLEGSAPVGFCSRRLSHVLIHFSG